jgi:hypothetical protein
LNSAENTHLIASEANGAKYETARMSIPSIFIVQPSWLEACAKQQIRVDEMDHALAVETEEENHNGQVLANDGDAIMANDGPNDHAINIVSSMRIVNADRHTRRTHNGQERILMSIFSACQFYFLGFADDDADQSLSNSISRLIRRGMGTIYWHANHAITHIVVQDGCDESTRYVMLSVSLVDAFR